MKPVSALVAMPLANPVQQPVSSNQASLNDEATELVNGLFKSLQAAKPAWRSAFPDSETLAAAKKTYVKGLIEAGITRRELIANGVRKARQDARPFFPSIGEFIAWCKPSADDLGMPSEDAAYREVNGNSHQVVAGCWSHPGVYEAGRRCGWLEIREGRVSIKQFSQVYRKVIAEIAAGALFQLPRADANSLEHLGGRKNRTRQNIEAGRQAIAGLKSMFTAEGAKS